MAGVSKMVHSIYYPETRLIKENLWKSLPHNIFESPYKKNQDNMHLPFFEAWVKWSKPVLDFTPFPYFYPTCGSSEAIQEKIALMPKDSSLHIFDGEYEGPELYASRYGINVVKHDRNYYFQSIYNTIKPGDQFYLSQPSSKDGNVWEGYENFIFWMNLIYPNIEIMLDLCYIGTVDKEYYINTNYNNINCIFFSLSKSMGVFYDRIGGVWSKKELLNLTENIWLKNVFSLKLGTELMNSYSIYELPRKYKNKQLKAINKINLNITSSDVVILGHSYPEHYNQLDEFLSRGTDGAKSVRYCLSPTMDQLVTSDI